jgi:hypothetical protein
VLGPFVKDAVFHRVVGMKRVDAIRMVADWPTIDDSDAFGSGRTLINNCLNAVRCLSGPLHIKDSDWEEWIGTASRQEVEELFQKYHRPR